MDINLAEEYACDNLGPFGDDPEKKTPFKFYIYPNLLDDVVVSQLRDAINSSAKLIPKDNDLYKFKQSKDFRYPAQAKKLPSIVHEFVDIMLEPIREHLEKKTGKKLCKKNFDITASRYDVGNYLLCHNDDIKDNVKQRGRSLAFIYYLNNRNWTKEDGGSLVLYDSDSTGEPVSINNQISPRPNTLIVFETSPIAWHAVSEVFCRDDFRLSINGWFHSETKIGSFTPDIEKSIEPCPYTLLKPIPLNPRLEKFFSETFNPEYMLESTCSVIRPRFKKKSEINLENFLVKERFNEISNALREITQDEENLMHVGPYNKRNYKVIRQDKLPQICKDLFDAFRCDLFFMVLSRLTGLHLTPPSLSGDNESEEEEEEDDDNDSGDLADDDDDDEDDDVDLGDDDEEEEEFEYNPEDFEKSIDIIEATKRDKIKKLDTSGESSKTKSRGSSTSKELETSTESSTKQCETSASSSKRIKLDEPCSSRDVEGDTKKSSKKKWKWDPMTRIQFRHLQQGSYTLIHDYGFELGETSALDVILHFNHDFEVNFDNGGFISYIDTTYEDDLHDMDFELLTVEPKSNCLSLVYRGDPGTCRFLKHITKAHPNNYHDLYCVYYEKPDDLPQPQASSSKQQ